MKETHMKWYHYLACFLAGVLLANAVPHFVMGVTSVPFPTPFSNPPGKGLSSPTVNVLWAMFNLVIGYLLFRGGKISKENKWGIVLLFAGILIMGMMLSVSFTELHH
jgi:FtsH-binding integral membrane protein